MKLRSFTFVSLVIAATLSGCAMSQERLDRTSTEQLCKIYYYGSPRSQPGVQQAKEELYRRGKEQCVIDAEPPQK